jgi:type III secretion control protein HpaP
VNHQVVRVIAAADGAEGADSQPTSGGRRARRIDYAALLRRGRTPQAQPREDAGGEADGETSQPDDVAPESARSAPNEGWHRQHAPGDTLAARIGTVSSPIIEAVYLQQQHFLDLSRRIAGEIAAFCGNRSISQAGTWDVRMPLDPDVLPRTLLLLSLSPVCLSLRFDVNDVQTQQLLLHHCGLLERELISLLDAWGAPRQVDITIW